MLRIRIGCGFHEWISVANSCQNFPASSAEKFGRFGKNLTPPGILLFWRHLWFRPRNYLCLCQWKKYNIYWTFQELERTKGENIRSRSSAPFRHFLYKIGPNSDANLSGRSTFFLVHAGELSDSWQRWNGYECGSRVRILGRDWQKNLKSFPPCYS